MNELDSILTASPDSADVDSVNLDTVENEDLGRILTTVDSNSVMRTELYKTGEVVPDRDVAMSERNYAVAGDEYIFGGVLTAFFLLALILSQSHRVLAYRIKSFFAGDRQVFADTPSDTYIGIASVLLMNCISAASLSLVYFHYISNDIHFNPVLEIPYWILLCVALSILAFIYLKAGVYSLVNWVFFDRESNGKWMSSYLFATSLTAFILFPIALIDVFFTDSATLVTGCVIMTGILYELALFYKLFVNFKTKNYGYLLIFLYFCSVEALPVLVFWNVMGWITDNFIVKNILY